MTNEAAHASTDDQPVDQTPGPEGATPVPERAMGRTAALVAMCAVALAILLLMLAPGIGVEQDKTVPASGSGESENSSANAAPGKEAPLDFTLKDMNGVTVKLASFKGKVILLNFWATWCGPCRAEIPSLVELQDQYPGDLVVLGFSVDDTPENLKPYAAQFKMNYPVLVGLGHEDVQDAFGPIWGIPVSVIIGRDGKIATKHSGIATKEQFEREIKALL